MVDGVCLYIACVLASCADVSLLMILFFFNDPPTTEIYTLSLHDALPIFPASCPSRSRSSRWCWPSAAPRSEEHTSELQSHSDLVCRLLLEKKNTHSTPRQRPSVQQLPSPARPCLSRSH